MFLFSNEARTSRDQMDDETSSVNRVVPVDDSFKSAIGEGDCSRLRVVVVDDDECDVATTRATTTTIIDDEDKFYDARTTQVPPPPPLVASSESDTESPLDNR